jgi:hypothetical protein
MGDVQASGEVEGECFCQGGVVANEIIIVGFFIASYGYVISSLLSTCISQGLLLFRWLGSFEWVVGRILKILEGSKYEVF